MSTNRISLQFYNWRPTWRSTQTTRRSTPSTQHTVHFHGMEVMLLHSVRTVGPSLRQSSWRSQLLTASCADRSHHRKTNVEKYGQNCNVAILPKQVSTQIFVKISCTEFYTHRTKSAEDTCKISVMPLSEVQISWHWISLNLQLLTDTRWCIMSVKQTVKQVTIQSRQYVNYKIERLYGNRSSSR